MAQAFRVIKLYRVIGSIRKEMIRSLLDSDRIRFDIPPDHRIIIAIVVVIESRLRIEVLPREAEIVCYRADGDRRFTERFVVRRPYHVARTVRHLLWGA